MPASVGEPEGGSKTPRCCVLDTPSDPGQLVGCCFDGEKGTPQRGALNESWRVHGFLLSHAPDEESEASEDLFPLVLPRDNSEPGMQVSFAARQLFFVIFLFFQEEEFAGMKMTAREEQKVTCCGDPAYKLTCREAAAIVGNTLAESMHVWLQVRHATIFDPFFSAGMTPLFVLRRGT